MPTYNDVYLELRRKLIAAGVTQAELEARELLCHAADKPREVFRRDLRLFLPEEKAEAARALLARRLKGEPAAYLTGEWEFMGFGFEITPEVLIPRSDTELLCERALACLPPEREGHRYRVLDLCAGSGCIGISMALERRDVSVVLADLSEGALQVARRNTRRHGVSARTMCIAADALAPAPDLLGSFDMIVSNPPYIPAGDIPGLDVSVRDYEPELALNGGADGLDFYRAIAGRYRRALKPGGTLLFEIGIGQAGDVTAILLQNDFSTVKYYRDLAGIQRVLESRR